MPDFIKPNELETDRHESSGEGRTFLDVRSPEEYAKGHIDGAINITLTDLEARVLDVPLGTKVVTYCNMFHPGSSRGEQAADRLSDLGFDAKALVGGFPAWRDAGLPVEAEAASLSEDKDR